MSTLQFFASQKYVDVLKVSGFSRVEVRKEKLVHDLRKSEWYAMLRSRFFSNLHSFTEQEMEDGIAELERGLLKGKDDVQVGDVHIFICAWK